jgi:L-ascorbate metabolism protein UlaG (beta-lactamase superfamily)
MLICFFGTTILTDPVLSDRVGIELFGKTIGIDRYTAPILTFEEIPTPDIILLSHAHFDHTDLPTLRRFAAAYPDKITVICAKNTQDVLDDLAWKNVIELDWDEEICAHDVKISALEVLHNGWRCPWERDRANGYTASGRSYNAYLLEKKECRLLFGGDTAFTTRFDELRHCGIDVAMMPIGAYQDYESLHCTPEQALQMATTMNAAYILPMHFGVFAQSNEAPEEPLQRLTSAASLYSSRVAAAQCGETFTLLPTSKL